MDIGVDLFKAATPVTPVAPQGNALRPGHLPPHSHLNILTTLRSIDRIADAWRALETKALVPPTVFQSYDWVSTWCHVYAGPESETEIRIVAGWRNNELVFVWPLQLRKRLGLSWLEWLSHPVGQYGDVLCALGEDLDTWLQAGFNLLRRDGHYDLAHLRHIRHNSTISLSKLPFLKTSGFCDLAPYFDMARFATIESYDSRLDRRQRKHRKVVRKHLDAMGVVEFQNLTLETGVENAIKNALAEKQKWLNKKGFISPVLSDPRLNELLKRFAVSQGSCVKSDVAQLSITGQPIAWELSLRYRDIHYCYIIARAMEIDDARPGRLIFDLNQRRSYLDGYRTYDLLTPNDPHKQSWSNASEPITDLYVPMSMRGTWAAEIYIRRLRPMLRRIYMLAPVFARKAIKRIAKF